MLQNFECVNIDVLKKLFGDSVMSGGEGKHIRQKCNQKFIDLYNKKIKVKNEGSSLEKEQTEDIEQQVLDTETV